MDVSIAKAAELLENDQRLTLRKLSASLNISFERTHHTVCVPGGYPGIKKQWFLLQDNARQHIAAVALAAPTAIGGTALQHPSYNLDLAPCDFWAFPTLKRQLPGKRFSSDEVKNATAAVLKGLSQNIVFHVFELLLKRCKKCIQCEGRYFEKEKIVGPVESSDSE
jgi:hypothetical protein